MTESVLEALVPTANEAAHAGAEPDAVQDAGTPDAGAPAAPAGAGKADAQVPAAASGEGAAGEHRDQNGAEAKVTQVPHGALHEARERIKALTVQIDELKKQPQLSEEEREILKDLKAQRAAEKAPKTPEFLEDPKGYIDAKEKAVTEALKKLSEADTARTEAEKQQQAQAALVATLAGHETAFIAKTPDYHDALTHMRNVRTSQLKMMFPQATDQQIQQHIGREELGGAQQILQAGGNPAEFAYNYAKTLGYTPKQAAAAAAAAANGADPPNKPDKDAVRTLGGGGGAEPEEETGDPMPEFTQALKERFTRKRK